VSKTAKAAISVGDPAPDFTLRDGSDEEWQLSARRGKVVVLLFYPGDETPVCTRQMCAVRDHWEDYAATGAEVVGISTDSVESHRKFAEHHRLPLRLLADTAGVVADAYGVRSVIPNRTARAVFVIDPQGRISYRNTRSFIGLLLPPKDDKTIAAITQATSSGRY